MVPVVATPIRRGAGVTLSLVAGSGGRDALGAARSAGHRRAARPGAGRVHGAGNQTGPDGLFSEATFSVSVDNVDPELETPASDPETADVLTATNRPPTTFPIAAALNEGGTVAITLQGSEPDPEPPAFEINSAYGGAPPLPFDTTTNNGIFRDAVNSVSIFGSGAADVIEGGINDDTLFGGGGDDRISGGPGNDTIDGGDGDDELSGGAGDDRISGGSGIDTAVFGGNIEEYEIVAP